LGFSELKAPSLRSYFSYRLASAREASYPSSPGLKPTIQPNTQEAEYEEHVYPSSRPAPVHGSTVTCQRKQLECTQNTKTGHPCVDAPEVVLLTHLGYGYAYSYQPGSYCLARQGR
jgi:hypothetical protein